VKCNCLVPGQRAEISEIQSSNSAQLAETYEKSERFQSIKHHLNGQLKTALSVPQGETPEFATSFLWQVRINFYKTLQLNVSH